MIVMLVTSKFTLCREERQSGQKIKNLYANIMHTLTPCFRRLVSVGVHARDGKLLSLLSGLDLCLKGRINSSSYESNTSASHYDIALHIAISTLNFGNRVVKLGRAVHMPGAVCGFCVSSAMQCHQVA